MRLFSSLWDMWLQKSKSSWNYFRDHRLNSYPPPPPRKEKGKGENNKETKRKNPIWWSGIELLNFTDSRQNCSLQNHFLIVLTLQFFLYTSRYLDSCTLKLVSGGTSRWEMIAPLHKSPSSISWAAAFLCELCGWHLLHFRSACGYTQLSLPGRLCAQLKT